MSAISEGAVLSILMADYASMGADGKLNVIGGGVSALGYDPLAGITSRFTVIASVHIPGHILPEEGSIEIALYRDDRLVEMEQPGGAQPLRIGQSVRLEKPNHAGVTVRNRDRLVSSHHMVIDFSNGLPLSPDSLYEWRLKIDMDEAHSTRFPFTVLGAALTPPVVG